MSNELEKDIEKLFFCSESQACYDSSNADHEVQVSACHFRVQTAVRT